MFKKYLSEFVQGVVFVLTAATSVIGFLYDGMPIKFKVLIISVLFLLYGITFGIRFIKNKNKIYKEGSSRFFSFFSKWYSQPGKLSIFCSNLDWMIKDSNDLINTICDKGRDCTVYLREKTKPNIEHRLIDAGVQIFIVPDLLTRHRFSLLEYNNSVSLIIGDNKKDRNDLIEFKQENSASNPYMITVVQDLLDKIDEKNARKN